MIFNCSDVNTLNLESQIKLEKAEKELKDNLRLKKDLDSQKDGKKLQFEFSILDLRSKIDKHCFPWVVY